MKKTACALLMCLSAVAIAAEDDRHPQPIKKFGGLRGLNVGYMARTEPGDLPVLVWIVRHVQIDNSKENGDKGKSKKLKSRWVPMLAVDVLREQDVVKRAKGTKVDRDVFLKLAAKKKSIPILIAAEGDAVDIELRLFKPDTYVVNLKRTHQPLLFPASPKEPLPPMFGSTGTIAGQIGLSYSVSGIRLSSLFEINDLKRVDGEKVEIKEVKQELKLKSIPVLLTPGKEIDPRWRDMLRPEAYYLLDKDEPERKKDTSRE